MNCQFTEVSMPGSSSGGGGGRRSVVSDSLWPMGCNPPGFSVHGILQARILEWIAIPFPRGSSWSSNWTWVSCILYHLASLVAQTVKCLPTMWETWVLSLGWEDPLEKEMATHSSILAWKIPWTEAPGRLRSMGSQRVRHDWVTSLSLPSELQGSIPSKCIIRCPVY